MVPREAKPVKVIVCFPVLLYLLTTLLIRSAAGSLGYEKLMLRHRRIGVWTILKCVIIHAVTEHKRLTFIQYDNCYNEGQSGTPLITYNRYRNMSDALNATGRP